MVDRARASNAPTSVAEVIARMRAIDAELEPSDGVAIFNRMYLRVTELIEQVIAGGSALPLSFVDPATMADLDVRFAGLWLEAYDADVSGHSVPTAWRPSGRCAASGSSRSGSSTRSQTRSP